MKSSQKTNNYSQRPSEESKTTKSDDTLTSQQYHGIVSSIACLVLITYLLAIEKSLHLSLFSGQNIKKHDFNKLYNSVASYNQIKITPFYFSFKTLTFTCSHHNNLLKKPLNNKGLTQVLSNG